MQLAETNKFFCPQALAGGREMPCKGMECAAWRWSEPKFGSVERRRGYCGMAGDPKYPVNPDHEK